MQLFRRLFKTRGKMDMCNCFRTGMFFLMVSVVFCLSILFWGGSLLKKLWKKNLQRQAHGSMHLERTNTWRD